MLEFSSGFDFHVCVTIACHSASAYQISSKSDHPRRMPSYDVLSIFKMGVVSHIDYHKVTADHSRSANEALILILKFRLDRIYSFADIAIFMLSLFGLKLPIYVVVSAVVIVTNLSLVGSMVIDICMTCERDLV